METTRPLLLGSALLVATTPAWSAPLSLVNQFNPGDIGGVVGLTYDDANQLVWLYGSNAGEFRAYQPDGTFNHAVTRPGGAGDDADLDQIDVAFTLNQTLVPAGSLLYTDGESGEAEVYAVDPDTGTLIASLETDYGFSHTVGGAFHPGRGTLFFVQDTVPSGSDNDSVVAEVDPIDGSVINTFKIDDVLEGFTVFYGDLDVNPETGNLMIVSSNESSIAEFTPDGVFVAAHDMPAGVSGSSGIGLQHGGDCIWLTTPGGVVSHLVAFLRGDTDGDGDIDNTDLQKAIASFTGPVGLAGGRARATGDTDCDGDVDNSDLQAAIANFTGPVAVPVPEPASLVLLSAGAMLLVRRRRQ